MYSGYDLDTRLQVQYSDPLVNMWVKKDPNTGLKRLLFKPDLNTGPFNDWTTMDHSNTGLVWYSDPHCTLILQKTN